MRRLLASIALLACIGGAQAETYPSRPITLIVPAAPGGGNDTVARVIAEKMSRLLGQQLVVENRAGAGGTIAARQVARSDRTATRSVSAIRRRSRWRRRSCRMSATTR